MEPKISKSGSYVEEEVGAPETLFSLRNKFFKRTRDRAPYHSRGHPELVTTNISGGGAEAYCRAMLLEGHGMPIYKPEGDTGLPLAYLVDGVNLGDLGAMDEEGGFQYFCNIFRRPTHPANVGVAPREFLPIARTPDPKDIQVRATRNFFKPGTVIASPGVEVIKHSDSPLDVEFKIEGREGAVLILPEGATRYDMVSTDWLHDYLKRNALHWYQAINHYGSTSYTNGSLILVTGCDKTKEYGLAAFPEMPHTWRPSMTARYLHKPNYEGPWENRNSSALKFYYPPNVEHIPVTESTQHQCIFIRGIRISLSDESWRDAMPYYSVNPFAMILFEKRNPLYILLDKLKSWQKYRHTEKLAIERISRLHLFHPSYILNQVLLSKYPDAEVALSSDSAWCSVATKGHGTVSNMFELVSRVFDTHDHFQRNGIALLIPKPELPAKNDAHVTRPHPITQWVKAIYVVDYVASKLAAQRKRK